MLCCRCKKRPASVFITKNSENQTEGYCFECAKELGLKPVEDIMNKMGITDEFLGMMQDQMKSLAEMTEGMEEFEDETEEKSEESSDFKPGGAATFPFFQNIFGNMGTDGIKSGKEIPEEKNKNKRNKRKHLETYCYNLTQKAREGKIDAVIGREKEIGRTIQILSRRTKNNPCLIGEPGVGKTAIAEGLAIRIAQGLVPLRLKKRELYLLDLTALIAGTQFRGQFESRIKGLIEEVKTAGNIILFIDEVHNLVGTGDSAEGSSMNAANILKPALSRGEVQLIGATTFKEYRKYIEKDSALERRFQPITIEEPNIKSTTEVLLGIKSYYENYHRVKVSQDIINRAVVLSERYITDRFLPDKAIDLLDEACASAALRHVLMEQYDSLSEELNELKNQEEELIKPQVSGEEQQKTDYENLAIVRSKIAKLEGEIKELEPKALGISVTEKDLAHVIELWTGIPSSKVEENELKKLSNIEEKLKEKIIGQDEAVHSVAAAIRRSRVQISPRRRPASFIFVGGTGVGKTELVKVLAEELFDTTETLIRLDMSEYMEKHAVSRIIGAPPGYIGYDESGQITEKVRRRPYSVLLFDEIEKAHPDVMNILLQILDEGKITDAQGRLVNFENTVIIMTSNAGSDKKDGAVGFAKSCDDLTKEKALKALNDFLRPEFLSRIDEIIVFKNLTCNDFEKIADLLLKEYISNLFEKGIKLIYKEDTLQYLAEKSHGGKNAARDLRNLIRKEVEDKIATLIIENNEKEISKIELIIKKEELMACIST